MRGRLLTVWCVCAVRAQVGNRDQVILRLQSEVDTIQQQYTGMMEEMSIRDDEMARLNTRFKQVQGDNRQLHAQLEISQERISHGEKTLGSISTIASSTRSSRSRRSASATARRRLARSRRSTR